MDRNKGKLVPHELRPGNTAQSTIENNRLTHELKKLEHDKNVSISQLNASQAVLQKSLRAMVTGGQMSAQGAQEHAPTTPSPAPSNMLSPNTGATSRLRVADGANSRSSSRVNVIKADPDVLAATSTKSFDGHIIGGQAQRMRKLESRRSVGPWQGSAGSSGSRLTRSSMGMIMDGSLYNVPEAGALTGVEFTEEDVEQGVQDHSLPEFSSSGPPAGAAQPTKSGTATLLAPSALQPALDTAEAGHPEEDGTEAPLLAPYEAETTQPSQEETDATHPSKDLSEPPAHGSSGKAESKTTTAEADSSGIKLAVPTLPPAAKSDPATPEKGHTAHATPKSGQSLPPSRSHTASARARALGRTSRTSRTSAGAVRSIASPPPPVFPTAISQQVYTRAVERAFAAKCLKHSKFVTDLEMRQFVSQFLLVEQQNENFKRANEFVSRIVDAQATLQ